MALPLLMAVAHNPADAPLGPGLLLGQSAIGRITADNKRFVVDEAAAVDDLTLDADTDTDDDLMLGDSAGDGIGIGGGSSDGGLGGGDPFGSSFSEKSLENSIAAVFNKVAYGSTTTKRSIPDVFVPSLTTIATPSLTTYR